MDLDVLATLDAILVEIHAVQMSRDLLREANNSTGAIQAKQYGDDLQLLVPLFTGGPAPAFRAGYVEEAWPMLWNLSGSLVALNYLRDEKKNPLLSFSKESLIEQGRRHWMNFQPSKYRSLEINGGLDAALSAAADLTMQAMQIDQEAGYTQYEAWEKNREMYLLLPEEADASESGAAREGPIKHQCADDEAAQWAQQADEIRRNALDLGIPDLGEQATVTWANGFTRTGTIRDLWEDEDPDTGEPAMSGRLELPNGQNIGFSTYSEKVETPSSGNASRTSQDKAKRPDNAIPSPRVSDHVSEGVNLNPTIPINPSQNYSSQSTNSRTTRFLLIVLLVTLLGAGAYWWVQDRLDSEGEQMESARKERAEQASQAALAQLLDDMALQVNAVADWGAALTGGKWTTSMPVFTEALQKQWIIDRPILVRGRLLDVAMNSDGTYEILVEHNTRPWFHSNTLRVSLACPKSVATALIDAAKPNRRRSRSDIAITGSIHRIDRTTERDSEGNSITVLTGIGPCLSAKYLGD